MKSPVVTDAAHIRAQIESFLAGARRPALLEPGEEILALSSDNYAIEMRGSRLTLQAWDRSRNWVRRLTAIAAASNARIEIGCERFGGRKGQLYLLDLARPAGSEFSKRGSRLVFRERFRLFLRRQFPEWNLVDVSAEADLAHSLSPAFPRAFLKHGQHAWAAIAAPPESDAAGAVAFGLIWLAYLRGREHRVTLEGLAIYVPAGRERGAALRLLCLNPLAARFELFTYTPDDVLDRAEPRDFGNLDTRLEPCRAPAPIAGAWRDLVELPGVECVPRHDGRSSLRVRGIEFAEASAGGVSFGLAERRAAQPHHLSEIAGIAAELDRARSAGADALHPLYRQFPEAWLESMARAGIHTLDASLAAEPVYGQVPAFAAGERGVLDLLAVDRSGRLTVIELKASADLQLPLQALDYWIRVKWHLDRGEFSANGYFPGVELRRDPPRLMLVSPSLEFHPTTETLLAFLAPAIEVERIGLAVEWRKGLRVVFRLSGAQRPS